MAGGDPTRFSWSVKYITYSGKCCIFAAQSEHSLAVCVHNTILPLLFFFNSGEILIMHGFPLTRGIKARLAMSGGKGDEAAGSRVKEGATVIQRIVREVGGSTAFPLLTKTNSLDWVMLMRVKLKARGLWAAVTKGGADPQEDMMALDALVSTVPSVKEAWDAITTMRVSDDHVKKAAVQ
jgi:hypothetical protein